jgi:hypothetical protein
VKGMEVVYIHISSSSTFKFCHKYERFDNMGSDQSYTRGLVIFSPTRYSAERNF